mmetsp:Transcript_19821/g.76075  ORF Transcript_19821/g.76075 Transcript_19821/m.76075 type:complete len:133 (-) Transcript_19821:847-1245(-)
MLGWHTARSPRPQSLQAELSPLAHASNNHSPHSSLPACFALERTRKLHCDVRVVGFAATGPRRCRLPSLGVARLLCCVEVQLSDVKLDCHVALVGCRSAILPGRRSCTALPGRDGPLEATRTAETRDRSFCR